MALNAASLTSGEDATDATSFTTASVSPSDNALVLVAVLSRRQSATPDQPTLSGGGMAAWTHVAGSAFSSSGTQRARLDVFRALEATPGTGTLTIDYAGVTHSKAAWSIVEFTDVDTSGSNGAGAIVQSGTDSGTATSSTVTLSAFGSANNAGYGAFAHNANEATTEGSGFTELHDVAGSAPASGLQSEWKVNDASVDASWSTSSLYGAVAAEVKQSAGGTTHFGAASLALTVTAATAGKRATFSSAAAAAAVTVTTQARRTTFGTVAVPLTVNRATAAARTTFGQVARPETVNVTTNGTVQGDQFGAASVTLTASVSTAGRRTTFSAVSVTETVSRSTVGTRVTFGVVARTETLTATTAARLTARGALSLVETVNAVTNGTGGSAVTASRFGPPSPTGGADPGSPTVAVFGPPSPSGGFGAPSPV